MTTTWDNSHKARPRVGPWLWVGLAFVLLVVGGGMAMASTYNRLVGLDQAVQSQWAQVENVYQRRLDLIPNLVNTVRGAANFERDTFVGVAEARARAGQATAAIGRAPANAQQLAQFEAAQNGLSGALGRLMAVSERYPELRATQAFRDLQAQLEGTENRIAIERMRFNEAAQTFNTTRNRFPTAILASFFGSRFADKPYFHARAGADVAPTVQF